MTGCIIDTSKNPEKILDGTRFRDISCLEQLICILDLHTASQQVQKKVIKSTKDYKSPYKIKENRPYYGS